MTINPIARVLRTLGRLSIVLFLLLVSSTSGLVAAPPHPGGGPVEGPRWEPPARWVVSPGERGLQLTVGDRDVGASTRADPGDTAQVSGASTQRTVSAPDTLMQSYPYTIYLPIASYPSIPVSTVLTPFDANLYDLGGPSSWMNNYGKTPEIIVSSDGVSLDVLAQDYDSGTSWSAVLLHIEPSGSGYAVTQALTGLPMLDRVMGLDTDGSGNRYYATAVDESDIVDADYPPDDTYRSDIVRVIKVDPEGGVEFNIDLDVARHAYSSGAEMIINPMVAASARLAVGGDEIALVHGNNTEPDSNGVRHQKALSTRLDATTGAILRTSAVWVSHSFDQRLLYDGTSIIEHHLGDAYPRYIVFAPDPTTSHSLFHIKGDLGDNRTFTRLGNIALIESDPTYDYIALFATENNAGTADLINGPRNLAIVRFDGSANIDPNLPDTLTVVSKETQRTNRLRWLTSYSGSSNLHAERPKLVAIGGDQYIVLWEEWLETGGWYDTFNGVYGMRIDDEGNILQAATLLTDQHHLHRGDDAFFLDGRAAWMTGDEAEQQLIIHFVDSSLNYEMVTLD